MASLISIDLANIAKSISIAVNISTYFLSIDFQGSNHLKNMKGIMNMNRNI